MMPIGNGFAAHRKRAAAKSRPLKVKPSMTVSSPHVNRMRTISTELMRGVRSAPEHLEPMKNSDEARPQTVSVPRPETICSLA
jgi:hypothetical protein